MADAVIEANFEDVIADGGQGLERGVKLVNVARCQAQEPGGDVAVPITMGLDVFHIGHAVERVLQRLWKRGERQIESAVKVDVKQGL